MPSHPSYVPGCADMDHMSQYAVLMLPVSRELSARVYGFMRACTTAVCACSCPCVCVCVGVGGCACVCVCVHVPSSFLSAFFSVSFISASDN